MEKKKTRLNSTSEEILYNDSKYKGGVKNGKPHGKGIEIFSNGKKKFEGSYKNGLPHGKGILYNLNKDGKKIYAGMWKNGKRHGKGIRYDENDKKSFEAVFKEGKPLKTEKCIIYEDGKKTFEGTINGKGISYYPHNGKKMHKGMYKNGKFQGKGIYFMSDGSKFYEGSFKKNKRHGKGISYVNGKKVYEGMYKNGVEHGKGKSFYWITGTKKYEGMFKENTFHGIQYDRENGAIIYKGMFRDNVYHGKGIEYDRNNGAIIYKGMFRDNVYHGKGTLYKDGKIDFKGEFIEGEKTISTKDKNSIIKANKILLNNDELYKKADEKNLLSPINYQLVEEPVTLHTRDESNNKFDEQHIYDRSQIRNLPNNVSPMTRREIVQVRNNDKKKKEILNFVKEVLNHKK